MDFSLRSVVAVVSGMRLSAIRRAYSPTCDRATFRRRRRASEYGVVIRQRERRFELDVEATAELRRSRSEEGN